METLKCKMKNSDLFIGENAIYRVEQYINNANTSIKVISPYLSKSQIKKLIKKQNDGVNIELITSNECLNSNDYQNLLKTMIKQNEYLLTDKQEKRNMFLGMLIATLLIFIVLCVISIMPSLNILPIKEYFFIHIIFAIILITEYNTYINWRIYSYEYETVFPIKVVKEPFIHSKVFIIDDKTAFVGSMNFTFQTKKNVETCVTIYDTDCVSQMSQYFDYINDLYLKEADIVSFGKKYFKERVN